MPIDLEKLTDHEFDDLSNAVTLINLAHKVAREYGLNNMGEWELADLSLEIFNEERRRGKIIATITEVCE